MPPRRDLRNVVLAARIMYTDNATFSTATSAAGGLVSIIPNMCYVDGATDSAANGIVTCASGAGGGSISVTSTAAQFSAARLSSSQSCFVILDAVTGTKYGKTTLANCNADVGRQPRQRDGHDARRRRLVGAPTRSRVILGPPTRRTLKHRNQPTETGCIGASQ